VCLFGRLTGALETNRLTNQLSEDPWNVHNIKYPHRCSYNHNGISQLPDFSSLLFCSRVSTLPLHAANADLQLRNQIWKVSSHKSWRLRFLNVYEDYRSGSRACFPPTLCGRQHAGISRKRLDSEWTPYMDMHAASCLRHCVCDVCLSAYITVALNSLCAFNAAYCCRLLLCDCILWSTTRKPKTVQNFNDLASVGDLLAAVITAMLFKSWRLIDRLCRKFWNPKQTLYDDERETFWCQNFTFQNVQIIQAYRNSENDYNFQSMLNQMNLKVVFENAFFVIQFVQTSDLHFHVFDPFVIMWCQNLKEDLAFLGQAAAVKSTDYRVQVIFAFAVFL